MTAISLRKRPAQQRSRQTVDAVLEAAAQILEAEGLPAFNTNALAARAGVSVGSIYQYFPGKDAVMVALVRREAARFEAALAQALDAVVGLPLGAAVERLVAVGVAHQTARPNLARILDLEERRLGIGAEADAATERASERLADFLAARGVPDPRIAAGDLLSLTRGMIDGALDAPPTDLTRRIVRAARGYLTA
jgi:AcrR family transcriptional regulator